ncbi:hypothetical protein VPNG_06639 [Cytospora leucostoma]|uniref:Uncharacterized protein n=1 Tax=Cytospora leucostoma TaxID=1230097 RepID=A0A423WU59_9PEZI|nr:hypothetical protein VPNG_06639 [Cytospora leucostoma]
MDHYPDEASSESLITMEDDDATTVNGTATPVASPVQVKRCDELKQGESGSLSCQIKELQLPSTRKTIYEAWTLTYNWPTAQMDKRHDILNCTWWLNFPVGEGHVSIIEPKTHYSQKELASVVSAAHEQHPSRTTWSYDEDVEDRLRRLDRPVQEELYRLLRDRTENASNQFRRREYRIVVMTEVHGGDMTDACSRPRGQKRLFHCLRKGKKPMAPHVEYRVILRGSEVKRNDAGWGVYDRYAKPWKLADEAELANARDKYGYQEILDC